MNLNSLQLYDLWHNAPEREFRQVFGGDSAYSRSYYRMLRAAVYQEAVNDGACMLLNELLSFAHANWDLVTFYAILHTTKYLSVRRELPEPDRLYLEAMDGNRYPWHNLSRGSRVAMTLDRRYILNLTCALYREMGPRSETPAPTEDARRILAEARSEADRILESATHARDTMLRQAREQAELVESTALERASSIELDAQRKVQEITLEARQNAEECYEQAYEDAREKAMERLEAEAAAERQRLVQQNLANYMSSQRQQWLDEQGQAEQLHQSIAGQTATLKEQICQQTTTAGADMAQLLDDTLTQLTALKNGFFTGLQDWRASLYKAEYGPLINCYNNLLMLISGFDRDIAAEQQRLGDAPAGPELTVLQQHSNKMEKFRINMERAMLALGLRVFRPAEGDLFDSYAHATDDEEDDDSYNGCAIARCVRPGIIRTVNSANEEVLHRATVVISRPSDAFGPQYND